MTDPHGIVPDDLQLAKMTGKKLTFLLEGIVSGGFCGLAVGCSLDTYLATGFKRIGAFIEILRTTETTFGSQSEPDLKRLVEELHNCFLGFQDCYVLLNQQRQMEFGVIETNVDNLLSAYVKLMEVQNKFLTFLGVQPADLNEQCTAAKGIADAFLREISERAV